MFYSQFGQDALLDQLFNQMTGGFFIDVGAHDGVTYNNTLFLERERQWTGINIEPLPHVFDQLVKNRPDMINLNVAIDKQAGKSNFYFNQGYTEMLSGLVDYYDERHYQRLHRELAQFGGQSSIIQIDTVPLSDIFKQYTIHHVDVLCIDVEGAEEAVLQSMGLNPPSINVIMFENNYPDQGQCIIDHLQNQGYTLWASNADVIMVHSRMMTKIEQG